MTHQPDCGCDVFVHPKPLEIDAGLSTIPRQIASFPEFRHAMLSELPTKNALADWRARGDQDLGVMLIEMWAYVCDVVSFYDETIAHETYLRTARLAPSVRKLVGLLGYRPRPAVAARARLAIRADGRLPLVMPAGLAFRSSAFGSEPPQVFELDADITVHPLLNGWSLAPVRPTTISAGTRALLLAPASARVKADDHLVVLGGATPSPVYTAVSVEAVTGADGSPYRKVTLDHGLASDLALATARLVRPNGAAALWSSSSDTTSGLATGVTWLYLAGVVPQIRTGSSIVAHGPNGSVIFLITSVSQAARRIAAGSTIVTGSTTVTTPAINVPVTLIGISPAWPASMGANAAQITIEYDLQDAGTITAEVAPRIQPGDPLSLLPPIEAPPDGTQPGRFLLSDADGIALELAGGVDFAARTLNLTQGSNIGGPLDPPVAVYANVASVTRGESVAGEILGVGDGSTANQSFTLKKKPLTYVSAPTGADPGGVQNTLRVRVRDIEWTEVASFYNVASDATVYIVRQNDAGESAVTFGDGVAGSRLPSGAPIVATYRFGAGAASPPAGGITQLGKPIKGVTSVKNPVPAAGGDDAQPAAQVRTYAPRSALLFGRAVSIRDMEALAAGQTGVQAVQAGWMWDAQLQLPAVQIWYIGAQSIASDVATALRAATAPATPIKAAMATPIAADLVVNVLADPRYQASAVEAAVATRLSAAGSGLLSPELIGIGQPLYRSRIFAEVLAVDGATDVQGLLWQGQPFADYAQTPGPGAWFQVSLTVHATEDPNA